MSNAINCERVDSHICGGFSDTFVNIEKVVLEQLKMVNNSISIKECSINFDNKIKDAVVTVVFGIDESRCPILINANELANKISNRDQFIDNIVHQLNTCIVPDKSSNANTSQTPIALLTQNANETDSEDWDILSRAFTKFILNDLIQIRVLSKQNVLKYTHTEDDGLHLRVILSFNGARCELQIYKHPPAEGERTRVVHKHGPPRSHASHFIRARDDRKFSLPNCAVLYATHESRQQINKFMAE